MEKKYKPMLLTSAAYRRLEDARKLLQKNSASRVTFTDVVEEFVGKKMVLEKVGTELKEYISNFSYRLSFDRRVLGIVLFGSMAKGTYTKHSDIDVLVVVDANPFSFYDTGIKPLLEKLEPSRERLAGAGVYTHISSLVLSAGDLKTFRPLYLDMLDYGIVLYDRGGTVSAFFNRLRRIKHRRTVLGSAEVLEWE